MAADRLCDTPRLDDFGKERDEREYQMAQGRLAGPTERQAGKGDAQLGGGDHPVGVFEGLLDHVGANLAAFHQLGDARATDADQRKLCGHKEGIGEHEDDRLPGRPGRQIKESVP